MRIKSVNRKLAFILSAALILPIAGCGLAGKDENVKYVLTTGFSQDEIFRIENQSCYKPEMMLYLTNMQNQYEHVYGAQIWETSLEDESLQDNVKDVALARLAQIKCMQLLAREYEIVLTDEEKAKIETAATEYFQSLNDTEVKKMGITKDTVVEIYSEYLLATKVYDYIIQDVNPEISDDEARSIKVETILIKTYYLDENGERLEYTESEKKLAYEKAKCVIELLEQGYEFDDLVEEYNEDSKSIYSFGKGDMDETFETAAYNLDTDEVSGIVQTDYGYHIIKCLSNFDEDETNVNKEKILEKRKNEAFNEVYDEYVLSLTKYINHDSWDEITFIEDEQVQTASLFDVYNSYFQ